MQETQVPSLGWEDTLKKGMATHSSILAWRTPWTEEPDGLQSMGITRVGHGWVSNTHKVFLGFPGGASGKEPTCQCRRHKRHGFHFWVGKILWRRAWQPTPVFLPGQSHGQRSLAGYGPWRLKELDMNKVTQHAHRTFPAPVIAPFSEKQYAGCQALPGWKPSCPLCVSSAEGKGSWRGILSTIWHLPARASSLIQLSLHSRVLQAVCSRRDWNGKMSTDQCLLKKKRTPNTFESIMGLALFILRVPFLFLITHIYFSIQLKRHLQGNP